jgi:hypothetical protein
MRTENCIRNCEKVHYFEEPVMDDNMSACKVAELFQIQKITSRHAAARSQSNECHQEIDFQNHIYFTSSDKAK